MKNFIRIFFKNRFGHVSEYLVFLRNLCNVNCIEFTQYDSIHSICRKEHHFRDQHTETELSVIDDQSKV